MNIEKIEASVICWANNRNLIEGTTVEKQCLKLSEEVGELCRAVLHNKRDDTIDGIGDCLVVLTNICEKLKIDGGLYTCFLQTWNEIKDRQGVMINGTFVKASDIDNSPPP